MPGPVCGLQSHASFHLNMAASVFCLPYLSPAAPSGAASAGKSFSSGPVMLEEADCCKSSEYSWEGGGDIRSACDASPGILPTSGSKKERMDAWNPAACDPWEREGSRVPLLLRSALCEPQIKPRVRGELREACLLPTPTRLPA